MNRRELIKGIGAAICAGVVPKFVPGLIEPGYSALIEGEVAAKLVSLSDMLNAYLGENLFKEELIKTDYLIRENIKQHSWVGRDLVVPFKTT